MIPAAVAIGAGVSALLPLVTEMLREKPDPEAAKMLVQSKRQELIDQKIGGGLTRANAEKAVDEELGKAMAEADRQGQFNTPVGEMVAGAILGGVGGWAGGKLLSKFAPNVAKKFGMGAADEAASKVSAAPTAAQVAPTAQPPVTKKSMSDLVTADELAPVQMRAEAMSRMKPSAIDIRNTRMLNNVPAPVRQPPPASPTVPAATKQTAGPFPLTGDEAAAAEALRKKQYYEKLATLDDGTQDLVDEMVPASRIPVGMRSMPQGPFPEFLPGEMQSRTPSAMLRPWESMPEVEGAMIRRELGELGADPRGIVNRLPASMDDADIAAAIGDARNRYSSGVSSRLSGEIADIRSELDSLSADPRGIVTQVPRLLDDAVLVKRALRRHNADPRGIVNLLPPESGPFPTSEGARMYSNLYRYGGG